MPRSVAEIQADIDRVKAQIAYNQKYSQGFAQPSTKVGWNSYIINNDRGLLDAYQARENAWKQQQANIDLQREMAEKNKEISAQEQEAAKKKDVSRLMNEVELAEADYNAAKDLFDVSKPETAANVKKMAAKLNYLGSQLPYEFTPVQDTFTEDAEPVKINKAVAGVKALIKTDPKKWTDADKQRYVDLMETIPDTDERKAELVVSLKNMPKTTNERERNEYNRLIDLATDPVTGEINLNLLESKDRARFNTLNKKYGNK